MKQKLLKMVELQKALDNRIYSTFNCEYDEYKTRIAFIDELGELTHELKAEWCYWKKTQTPVNRERVLDELVDCWHFVLSQSYHLDRNKFEDGIDNFVDLANEIKEPTKFTSKDLDEYLNLVAILIIRISYCACFNMMLGLSNLLGFTFEEVYNAYIRKNKENHERQNRGY